tara:strand:+ start:236 stop:1108 length:873 start_codon:yes stop_codon:yes gene_type:complete
MFPMLKLLADGKERSIGDITGPLADQFGLTDDERSRLLTSGQKVLANRLGWARTYLNKAGLIESPQRGIWKISDEGLAVIRENPPEINTKFLKRYEGIKEFLIGNKKNPTDKVTIETTTTPDEALGAAYEKLRSALESEILDSLKSCSPGFFEKVVVDVLVAMGYGGNRMDAAQVLGKSGDGGIDGIIKEDQLGLDVIYVQAKRWEGSVGRPEIQKFAGALQGVRARKGVFITTSDYTSGAREFVNNIDFRIVLVGGKELAEIMADHGVGVFTTETLHLKKVDMDYFTEE